MSERPDLWHQQRHARCRDCAHRDQIRPRLPSLHPRCRVSGARCGDLRRRRVCLHFEPGPPVPPSPAERVRAVLETQGLGHALAELVELDGGLIGVRLARDLPTQETHVALTLIGAALRHPLEIES